MSKKEASKLAALVQSLSKQQQAVDKKEAELRELQQKLAAQQKSFDDLCRETGSRKQRVNVNTLRGPPDVKQVGGEMVEQIRRRRLRYKESLRDKLNKLTAKLGAKQATNRELKAEIDGRRRARLHHLAAIKSGGAQVERSQDEISELIVASQRAYAEKETIVLKLGELKRRAKEEAKHYAQEMEAAEGAIEELDEACRARDAELDDLVKEVAAANALAKDAEGERAVELERFAAVRNQRLELQNALDNVYATLHVNSFGELADSYRVTSSKILSLWGKQGEQEGELEQLEAELARIERETEAITASETRWRQLALSRAATRKGQEKEERESAQDGEQRELLLGNLCRSLNAAFKEVPLLRAQLPESDKVNVNAHTVLRHLGLLEAVVVRLVGKKVATAAAEASAARAAAEAAEAAAAEQALMAAAAGGDGAGGAAASPPGSPAAGGAATSGKEVEAAAPAAEEDDGTGWRGRIGVVAPSMSEHGAASLSLHGLGDGRGGRGEASSPSGSGGGSGLENLKEKLKYGRPSLRSELMKQILSGVAHQMDRLAEEERGIKSEDHHHHHHHHKGSRHSLGGSGSHAHIDKAQRDSSIDEWLARRRGGPPAHTPILGGGGGGGGGDDGELAATFSMGASLPPARAPRRGGRTLNTKGEALGSSAGLRANRSAPMLFKANSGREILNEVTRVTSDRAASRKFAAEMLPKLPGTSEEQAAADGYGGGGYGSVGAFLSDAAAADGEGGGAADPRREIEEINRRLQLLEQERMQIHQLRSMAVATVLAPPTAGGAGANGGAMAPPPLMPPVTAPGSFPPPRGLGSSTSFTSLGGGGGSRNLGPANGAPMPGSRSSGNLIAPPGAGGGRPMSKPR